MLKNTVLPTTSVRRMSGQSSLAVSSQDSVPAASAHVDGSGQSSLAVLSGVRSSTVEDEYFLWMACWEEAGKRPSLCGWKFAKLFDRVRRMRQALFDDP